MKAPGAVRDAGPVAIAIATVGALFLVSACKPSSVQGKHPTAPTHDRGYQAELDAFDTVKSLAELRKGVAIEYSSLTKRLNLPERCTETSSTPDVDAIWHIVDWAAFYTLEAAYADRARECLDILQSRGLGDNYHVELTHKVLAINHRGEGAESLRKENPDLDLAIFPEIRDTRTTRDGISVMRPVASEANAVELVSVPLRGDHFLVIASSHCGFSRKAAQDIADDQSLSTRMKSVHWMALPHDIAALADTRKWNQTFPATPLSIVYDFSPLAELKFQTPTFVHVKDGIVIDTFSGWPGPAQKDKLREFLAH